MTVTEKWIVRGLEMLKEEFGAARVDSSVDAVKQFEVEVPSWAFGSFGGGRFGGYTPPGGARNIEEKLDDAKCVHELTGAAPRVATHVLWDFSQDGLEPDYDIAVRVHRQAHARGLALGAVNPTFFLAGSHRGSFSSPDAPTRSRYIAQMLFAGRVAAELANKLLTPWFPDGSIYPGQVELRGAYERLRDSLVEVGSGLGRDITILIEYKVFEPGTYSTTIPDWGASLALAKRIGPNAGVLVDMGHHHPTANVEQIVAMLLAEGVPGGFHFNTRYAADDDHSVEPNQQMARIFYELDGAGWAYMIDQSIVRENRMQAILHSIDSLQLSIAKAMLVDRDKLAEYQQNDDVMRANRLQNDALINADARPIVARARIDKGLPSDPVAAYIASGYQAGIERTRETK